MTMTRRRRRERNQQQRPRSKITDDAAPSTLLKQRSTSSRTLENSNLHKIKLTLLSEREIMTVVGPGGGSRRSTKSWWSMIASSLGVCSCLALSSTIKPAQLRKWASIARWKTKYMAKNILNLCLILWCCCIIMRLCRSRRHTLLLVSE